MPPVVWKQEKTNSQQKISYRVISQNGGVPISSRRIEPTILVDECLQLGEQFWHILNSVEVYLIVTITVKKTVEIGRMSTERHADRYKFILYICQDIVYALFFSIVTE